MPNEPTSGGRPQTVSAPPFRELLSTPPPAVAPRGDEPRTALPVVPGYEIVSELGRGGMGVVYQARQCSLKRLVALKMILAGGHADPAARTRFRTEAEAVARLQHPNIVQVYEVGEHDGLPFLVLECLAGGSLGQSPGGGGRPEREAARLVETIARATQHAHERGILHRDLKPANVLLAADGTPKITDFGLAKLVDQGGGPASTASLIGTPAYMSPEQAAGDTERIGVSSDVYALGAILYELLTGQPPFRGSTPLETLEQVRAREPVQPRRAGAAVSADLETICLKCLEKEPGNRYASAGELADDIRRFQEGEPVRARPIPPWRRLWRSARSRPALAAKVACATALLCLLFARVWYLRVADRLDRQHVEEQYQQFLNSRDDAIFYGLLGPEPGGFLERDPITNSTSAEAAARKALALAGVDPTAETPAVDPSFPPERRAKIAADSYTLLLVLASTRARQTTPGADGENRYREAFQLLACARKLGFETRAYHLRRAHLLEVSGKLGEARAERDRANSLPIGGALDHFLVGEELCRRGDWEAARASFNRALAQQPGHFWAQFLLAVGHLKSRDWEAARAGLNACLARRPDFVWAYLYRSFANEQLRALPEAEADFRKAMELNPGEDVRYALFLTRGILHFGLGELDRAADDFHSAVALKPDWYNAYFNLAHVHLARGSYGEAAEQVRTALPLRPPAQVVFGYHAERGRRLLHDDRYEDAIRACDEALGLVPDQPFPEAVRARALLALGRYEPAERSFDRYLRTGGEAVPDVFRGRGLARMKLGRYPEAAEDYTRALQSAPDAELYQHRGWAYFFSDAWKLALRDFSKAIELRPGTGDSHTGRGLARVMLGEYRDAVADAELSLRLRPSTPEMMHNVACIFAQAAARAEAEAAESYQLRAEDYRRRAVGVVRQTLEMLSPEERPAFWRDKVLPDAALVPLRNDPRFTRLQEELTRPSGTPPGSGKPVLRVRP